ncbi:MAG: hypothetical protein QNJ16_04565 [Rhodobacter sp.]|nr:hypothetical protein [Rhodobacter sp.]
MKPLILAAAVALSATATMGSAAPNAQLVASVEIGLHRYGLSADVSQFATPTVAALHLALSQPEGYIKTRRRLKSILRNAKFK